MAGALRTLRAVEPDRFDFFDWRRYSFSLGVTDGVDVWLSGHSASRFDESSGHIVVSGGMAEQARVAWEKVLCLLEAAGLGAADVVHVVENVTPHGLAAYAEAAAARDEVLGSTRAAVSTVVVRSLLRPDALIEVEVSARAGGGTGSLPTSDGLPPSAAGHLSWAEAGGLVHLGTLLPVGSDGEVIAPGDLVAQTEAVFSKAARVLGQLGLGPSSIVKTVDFTMPSTRREYPKTGAIRRSFLGPVYPASAGILMPALGREGCLVALEALAARGEPVAVNPGWSRYDRLTYTPAVRVGNLLLCSGQAALDPETEEAVCPGDVAAQADWAYASLLRVLQAAGAGPEALVRTVEYVTPEGLSGYRSVADVRRARLVAPWPASTGIVCEGLLRREFLIEVDATAVLPEMAA
jgi:enamine deaminase RidA (YjgF/YER057c/UK114 family)